MSKPDDIPQDIWDLANECAGSVQMPGGEGHAILRAELAEVIMAATAAEREASAVAGWNACRKSIYAVCEDMTERQYNAARAVPLRGLPTPTQEAHSRGFYAGGKDAAKSLARGFNSMEAMDDDNLTDAIRKRGEG